MTWHLEKQEEYALIYHCDTLTRTPPASQGAILLSLCSSIVQVKLTVFDLDIRPLELFLNWSFVA